MQWAEHLYNGTLGEFLHNHWINLIGILVAALIANFIGVRIVRFSVKHISHGARHRSWHRKDIEKRQKTLSNLFVTIWHILVFSISVYAVLHEIFPDVSTVLAPLFASAGILGVAFGFGAQSLIKDFLSGIFIISENQFRVGDIIEIDGFSGTVERIGTRSTVLRDADGNVHYFPNGVIAHVINKTMGFSMARFTLLVKPDTDVDRLTDVIDETGKDLAEEDAWKDKILQAPSFTSLGDITGNSIEVIIAGKTQPSDQWAVTAEMRRRLHQAFEKNNIELAITPAATGRKR